MTTAWMNLLLALAPLVTGPYGAVAGPLAALVMALVKGWTTAAAQSGELTPEEVAAFDAKLATLEASPEWQVRP
jgi:hypothetical protein